MKKLSQNDEDLVNAELEKLLKSADFEKATKKSKVLRFLVEQALRGETITETSIAQAPPYKMTTRTFNPALSGTVRQMVGVIRKNLDDFYSTSTDAHAVRIMLPERSYTPRFDFLRLPDPPEAPVEEQISVVQAVPPEPPIEEQVSAVLAVSPGPPMPKPTAPPFRPARDSATGVSPLQPAAPTTPPPSPTPRWIIAAAVVTCVVVALGIWQGFVAQCPAKIEIVRAGANGTVGRIEAIEVSRGATQWFCKCNDYLIVEADGRWWVQTRLDAGRQAAGTAHFGDSNTPTGKQFNVFVLSTPATLDEGVALIPGSPGLAGAVTSPAVTVTLKQPGDPDR